MEPVTRLLLINLYQGLADSLREGTLSLTEEQAHTLLQGFSPLKHKSMQLRICNITQACRYIGVSQPTFRKLVRQGVLPKGEKIAGFRELIWYKDDIEGYCKEKKTQCKHAKLATTHKQSTAVWIKK